MARVGASILKVLAFEAFLGLVLFGSAGRLDLPWVWALLAVHAGWLMVAFTFMDPTLARERARPGPGAQDVNLRRVITVMLIVHLVVAGLDVGRYHWSGAVPAWARAAALVLFTLGMGFSIWASVVNRFFSSAIRLQTDRGHHVIDSGPYRIVRHPGYLGLLVAAMSSGVVYGSWWSLVPLGVAGAVVVRRMVMEDGFLHRELAGYATYAGRVRYKLVPGLW